jgi:hypothetical protein
MDGNCKMRLVVVALAALALAGGGCTELQEVATATRDTSGFVYRQDAMFMTYLKDRHAVTFSHFIASLEGGAAFQRSFEDAYRADIGTTWGAFVAKLAQARAPAAGE